MPATSEQHLLDDFVSSRSEDSFQGLVGIHIDMVFGCALRTTRDRGLAEEIAQNVFTILARKAHRLKAGAGLAGWLHKTTLYETKKALRGRLRRERKMKALVEQAEPAGESAAAEDEIFSRVDEAIDGLPEGDRQLVLMHYLEGQTFAEISQQLGKSEGACQRQASRAIAKLRAILGRRGVVASVAGLGAILTTASVEAAPVGLVSSISSGAVAGASTLTTTALLANAIQTMTYAKTKIAIFMAAAAAVPIGVQIRSNGDLKEDLRAYEHRETVFAEQTERLAQLEKAIAELPGGTEAIARISGNDRPLVAVQRDGESSSLRKVGAAKKSPLAGLSGGNGAKAKIGNSDVEQVADVPELAVAAELGEVGDLMENPAMLHLLKKQMEMQIELSHGALFDHLGLEGERRAEVLAAMLGQMQDAADTAESLDLTDPDIVSQVVAELEIHDSKLKKLLGNEDFEVFERYEDSAAEREELAVFRTALEEQGQKLPFELEQKLMTIMHEEENRPEASVADAEANSILMEQIKEIQGGVISPEVAGALVAIDGEKQARVLSRAAELLTPEQLGFFKRNQEVHLARTSHTLPVNPCETRQLLRCA